MATRRLPCRQHGAALLIFLVLVVVGGLAYLLTSLTPEAMQARRNQLTQEALAQARDALLGYAITYRDSHPDQVFGYLPCPDTDGDGSPDTIMTSTGCGASGETVIGLLPFKILGLSDLRDASGSCLWYSVSGTFKASITKPTPVNFDTQGQLAITSPTGEVLALPEDSDGGAAAVIIAVGPPRTGQARTQANTLCGVTNAASVWQAYVDSGNFPGASGATVTLTSGIINSGTNNDALAWITPRKIFNGLMKRSDFADQINTLAGHLVTSLTAAAPGGPLPYPTPDDSVAVGNKLTGKFPSALAVPTTPNDYEPYRDNWRDLFRYVVCTPSSACLTVNGASCMGALLFSGERSAGGPRTAAEKTSATSLFEDPNRAAYTTAGNNTFAGSPTFAAASPAQDMLFCLNSPPLPPQPPLSAPQIIAQGQQADSGGTVSVDTTANTVSLGDPAVGAASGCFWYGTPIPFGQGLRIYFKFVIETDIDGSGFAVALADKGTNSNLANTCGDVGAYLGYAGGNVNAPKIGVEFDMYGSSGGIDWPFSGPGGDHVAIDYWGTADIYDDVTHGAGAGTPTEPRNPQTGSPGVIGMPLNAGTPYYVRIDIDRDYDGPTLQASYDIKTFATTSTACLTELQDLTTDFSPGPCPSIFTVSNSRILANPGGTVEAMQYVYFGLTQGQVGDQRITFYDIAIQGR